MTASTPTCPPCAHAPHDRTAPSADDFRIAASWLDACAGVSDCNDPESAAIARVAVWMRAEAGKLRQIDRLRTLVGAIFPLSGMTARGAS